MKILTILGARPQFIKAAVLSRAFKKYPDIKEYIVHTGQHYDDNMSAVFFKELGLKQADLNLGIQASSNAEAIAQMLPALESIINQQNPDLVLVYGDTNSTLAGAIAAKICKTRLAHVEAGMRHGDLTISEELNRVLTDSISDLLFCSTPVALNNVQNEGIDKRNARAYLCGDLMLDAAMHYESVAGQRPSLLPFGTQNSFALCTLHRAENVDNKEKLVSLFSALDRIHEQVPVILPLHPRTRKRMAEFGISTRVSLTEPAGYLDLLNLLQHCSIVLTDSGGLQKEAYYFHKHIVLLREQTEWIELEKNNYLVCAGTNPERIMEAFGKLSKSSGSFNEEFYGKGDAGERIAEIINGL